MDVANRRADQGGDEQGHEPTHDEFATQRANDIGATHRSERQEGADGQVDTAGQDDISHTNPDNAID